MPITVLLVDDHPLFRKGLRVLFDEEKDIRVVGEADGGRAAVEQVQELSPDVVVMDISMPDMNGIEATRQIISSSPNTKVMALSIHGGKQFVKDMLGAGASGYILKDSVPEELVEGIRKVMRNEVVLSNTITGVVVRGFLETRKEVSASEEPDQSAADGAAFILPTKLQRPAVAPDILPRARLLDRLNEGRQRTLTLISAPAGYGKSTLASRWVASCDCPAGWVSLDESDSDPRMFLSYVLSSIRSLFPKAELRSEALLEANPLPPVEVLARHLLNDLHEITEPFILVLDDFQLIRGESPLHDLLTQFLIHPPQMAHLVLLTRRDPPLPFSRLRGRGQVNEIRAADLRFTLAEAKKFLKDKLKIPVDDDTAALLEKKTEGWVTGLRLAGLYLHDRDDLKDRVQELTGSSRHITEYLTSEVLSRQDPKMAACLVETSILDRFCAPLCRAVHSTGAEGRDFNAQRFIDWLEKTNLFVVPLDDQGYWFRYHHLFQKFLQSLLQKQSNADAVAKLHLQASKWFAENGLIDEAIQQALAAGDTQAAIRLVVDHRYDLLNNAQYFRLNKWLALLPGDEVANDPVLAVTKAIIALENGQVEEIVTNTEKARRMSNALSRESSEYAAIQAEIATLQCVLKAISGQPAGVFDTGQKALESLPRQAIFLRTLATAAMAVCSQMEGNTSLGVKVLRDELKNPGRASGIQTRIWFYLTLVNYLDVDATETLHSGRMALKLAKESNLAHTSGLSLYFLGAVHYLRNELAEARSYLLGVLDYRAMTNSSYTTQASAILAFISLAKGIPEEAKDLIDRVGDNPWERGDHYSPAVRRALRVELALRQGMVDEARRLSIGVDFNPFPPLWMFYVPQLTPIKLLLTDGTEESLKEARTRLVELDEQMNRINRKSVRIDVLALLALVYRELGDEEAALEKLRAALDIAEPAGWVRNFVDLGDPMRDLLERLNQADPGHKYAQLVLGAFRAEAGSSLSSGPSGQAPGPVLTQREIDTLPLVAEGLSNKQIAEKLCISTVTVKTHLQNIYRKLDAGGRIQAIKKARELGLIKDD